MELKKLEEILDLPAERQLSALCDLSQVQDSFRMRAQRRSRRIAEYLIDAQGELDIARLQNLIAELETTGYAYYSEGYHDGLLYRHQLKILKKLRESAFYKNIKKFQKPLANKWAEELIAAACNAQLPVNDAQIRRAVLSALLTLLRQNVGSCFATAPAILIQEEQVEALIADLYELLTTGKLKRTFGGVEHTVPLSPSTGLGDLQKPFRAPPPGLYATFQPAEIENFLKPEITADEVIQKVLLHQLKLKKSDVKETHKLKLPFVTFKKKEGAEVYEQKEKEAKAAFKAFVDHPLLKAWEFTLASFSEIKMEFSTWNLYSSLGFNPDEPGGIGEIIVHAVKEKIEEANQKIQELQVQYEVAYDQLRGTEAMLRNASSESALRRLRAENQSRYYHLQSCLEMRNQAHDSAAHLPSFYNFLLSQYEQKFPEYFQEIYDAEMQGFRGDLYDDSPAGFRLVYKYGRREAAAWKLIRTPEQWTEALTDFFQSVESHVVSNCQTEAAKEDVARMTTDIVHHVRRKSFLETALLRMSKAHHTPLYSLADLDKIEKKPWAYTSGGSMDTLIKTYFRREKEPTVESRQPESAMDLLIFLLDTLKSLPPRVTDPYIKSPEKGMLMQSPTHAFILHPGFELFKEGWNDNGFTYTWVRDVFLKPREDFFAKVLLSPSEQRFLFDRFSERLPPIVAHQTRKAFTYLSRHISIKEFSEALFAQLPKSYNLDSFLYESLPLTAMNEWKDKVRELLSFVKSTHLERIIDNLPDFPASYLTRKEVEDAAKSCLIDLKQEFDIQQVVAERSAQIGLAPPPPLLFADTNWAGFHFALLVSPVSGEIELWRMDRTGSTGYPMKGWIGWINGSKRLPWQIYTQPHEYLS